MNNIEKIISARSPDYPPGSKLPEYLLYDTASGSTPVPAVTLAHESGFIYLTGEIDDNLSNSFQILLRLGAEQGKDFKIFINSPGGSVLSGLAMYDVMKDYPYKIDIYCTGLAASMAAILLAGGRKGHRFIMPHSKVMVHEPLIPGNVGGSATSIQRTAESILETKKILNTLLAEFTGKTVEEIDKNTAFDNFFNAEQAIEFGLCDAIATGFENYR